MDEKRVYQIVGPNDAPLREPRELYARYSTLFPPCRTDGCNDIGDLGDGFCDRCASNREWERRRRTEVDDMTTNMNDPQTLDDIHRSLEHLYATKAERQAWLTSPHPSFHGRTPDYVIQCGRADAVLMVLEMILTSAVS